MPEINNKLSEIEVRMKKLEKNAEKLSQNILGSVLEGQVESAVIVDGSISYRDGGLDQRLYKIMETLGQVEDIISENLEAFGQPGTGENK